MKSFENKVAAITGAGSASVAPWPWSWAQAGLSPGPGRRQCRSSRGDPPIARQQRVRVSTAVVDVADREQVQAWADRAASEHGRVNLIFNNAGVAHAGTVEGSDYSEYEWIMNINFWGVVNGTKAFLPHLKASGAAMWSMSPASSGCSPSPA